MVTQPSHWTVMREPHAHVWIKPIYGWGFVEGIDGELAVPFEMLVEQSGVDIGEGVKGWRGQVFNSNHKYGGMNVEICPRHVDWDGFVNLRVCDGTKQIFSGFAESNGLECDWK